MALSPTLVQCFKEGLCTIGITFLSSCWFPTCIYASEFLQFTQLSWVTHHDPKQEDLNSLQEAQLSHHLPGSLCMWGEFGGKVHLIGVKLREKSESLNCH